MTTSIEALTDDAVEAQWQEAAAKDQARRARGEPEPLGARQRAARGPIRPLGPPIPWSVRRQGLMAVSLELACMRHPNADQVTATRRELDALRESINQAHASGQLAGLPPELRLKLARLLDLPLL